jgi:hypothetical protein
MNEETSLSSVLWDAELMGVGNLKGKVKEKGGMNRKVYIFADYLFSIFTSRWDIHGL